MIRKCQVLWSFLYWGNQWIGTPVQTQDLFEKKGPRVGLEIPSPEISQKLQSLRATGYLLLAWAFIPFINNPLPSPQALNLLESFKLLQSWFFLFRLPGSLYKKLWSLRARGQAALLREQEGQKREQKWPQMASDKVPSQAHMPLPPPLFALILPLLVFEPEWWFYSPKNDSRGTRD